VLYWTVMNLLTALQQWMVLRQDGHAPAASQVAVVADGSGKKHRTVTR
jgi:membrane protein insertase Oxa1/YidC/SpoIIIJ